MYLDKLLWVINGKSCSRSIRVSSRDFERMDARRSLIYRADLCIRWYRLTYNNQLRYGNYNFFYRVDYILALAKKI